MSQSLIFILFLLGIVVILFMMNRPRMDAVALLAICALPFTGVVTIQETLSGFSDANVILIAAMFVIGDGLVRTGVARWIGDWLVARSGNSLNKLITLLMLSVCGLGSTMSSTAVTALFIPIVLRICRQTGNAPGQLLLPLSYAALISGMMTLVATTPNLVVQSALIRDGKEGFDFFSITPFGLPILVLAILYMLLVKRWLTGKSTAEDTHSMQRPTFADWIKKYKLATRKHLLRIGDNSPLIGRTLESIALRHNDGANLISIQRNGSPLQPTAKLELCFNDTLLIDLFQKDRSVVLLADKYQLEEMPLQATAVLDSHQEIGLAEMFIPADSDLVGKTILKSKLRTRFGISVLGLRRGTQAIETEIHSEELKIGDTLLIVGPWKSIRSLIASRTKDIVALNLPKEFDDLLPAQGRMLPAVLILLAVIFAMVFGIVPNVHAALIGCLMMGAFRCITLESAYASIDWKTLLLIVGMLPFSLALERTGGVQLASELLLSLGVGLGTAGLLTAVFAVTMLLGLFVSNTATAVLMTPVALSIANQSSSSPYPFAMVVAIASSTAFITPVSSPVNALVVTPGGYRFQDFVKFGLPFALITMVTSVLLISLLMPTT